MLTYGEEQWPCNRSYRQTDKFKVISEGHLNEAELDYFPVWSEHYDYDEIDDIVSWGLDKNEVLKSFEKNEQGNGHCLYTLLEFNPFPARMRVFIKATLITNNGIELQGYIMNENAFCFIVFLDGGEYHFSRHPALRDLFEMEMEKLQLVLNMKTNEIFPIRYETGFFSKAGRKISGVIKLC